MRRCFVKLSKFRQQLQLQRTLTTLKLPHEDSSSVVVQNKSDGDKHFGHDAMLFFFKCRYKPETSIERGVGAALKSWKLQVQTADGKPLTKKKQKVLINQLLSPRSSNHDNDHNSGDNKPKRLVPIKTTNSIKTAEEVFDRMKSNPRFRNANGVTNQMMRALGLIEHHIPFDTLFASVLGPDFDDSIPKRFREWIDVPGLDDSYTLEMDRLAFTQLQYHFPEPTEPAVFFSLLKAICMREQDQPVEKKEIESVHLARELLWKVAGYLDRAREVKQFKLHLENHGITLTARPDFVILDKDRSILPKVVALGAVEVKRYTTTNLVGQPAMEAFICSIHNYSIQELAKPVIMPMFRFNGPYVSVSLYYYPPDYCINFITGSTLHGSQAPVAIHLSNRNGLGFNMLVKKERVNAFKLIRRASAFSTLPVEKKCQHEIIKLSENSSKL